MAKYQVIVSNVGTVYSGDNAENANRDFSECEELSKTNYGRFAGESVTMFIDGEPMREFTGTNEQDNS